MIVKNYKGVKAMKRVRPVTDDNVKNALLGIQMDYTAAQPIEGAAEEGDTVTLNYKGFVGDEQFEGGTADSYPLELGSGSFIPGFEEQLIGILPGEDRDVKVTFPEQYHAPNLAGKEAVFKCKAVSIARKQVPAIDDELAKMAGFENLEALKADLRKGLEDEAEKEALNAAAAIILDKILADNPVEADEEQVKAETAMMINMMIQQAAGSTMDVDTFCQAAGMSREQIEATVRPNAENNVKFRTLIHGIAEMENIEISVDEVNEKMAEMAEMFGIDVETLSTFASLDDLKEDMLADSVCRFLYENADITEA